MMCVRVCILFSCCPLWMDCKVRKLCMLVLCCGPRLGQAHGKQPLTVIRTCQYAGRGNADKFQIVSIADERSAEDARGVTLELPLLNKSHLPSSSKLPQAGKGQAFPALQPLLSPKSLCLPSLLHPYNPPPPIPFLLTLAKTLYMLIGGGLTQFAAVVDQWWITFPSFGCSPLAQGGGRTWRRKQQWSRTVVWRETMCVSVPPTALASHSASE